VPATGAGRESAHGARPELSAHIPEIDLHGFSERDALVTLELFLHHAYTQRTPRVRVIHGKGDGILRAAVRRALAHSPLVRAIDAGPHFRGDDGVTLAELDL
jgi:DNA mismatch repair protein MutS2